MTTTVQTGTYVDPERAKVTIVALADLWLAVFSGTGLAGSRPRGAP